MYPAPPVLCPVNPPWLESQIKIPSQENETYNHRMVWVERDLKDHPASTALPWAGTPFTRLGPPAPSGLGHFQGSRPCGTRCCSRTFLDPKPIHVREVFDHNCNIQEMIHSYYQSRQWQHDRHSTQGVSSYY